MRSNFNALLLTIVMALTFVACGDDSSGPPALFPAETDAGESTPESDVLTADDADVKGSEEADGDGTEASEPTDADAEGDTAEPESDAGDADSGVETEDVLPDAEEVGDAEDAADTGEETEDVVVIVGCQSDEECAEAVAYGPCEMAVCMPDNTCLVIGNETPDCCESLLDCDDENSVTIDSCPGPGMSCDHIPDGTACPQNTVFLNSDFDDGTSQGWNLQLYQGAENIDWHVSSRRASSGSFSLRFGREDCPTYYTGELEEDCQLTAAGEANSINTYTAAISPEMNLLSDTVVLMSMYVWADMEFLGEGIDESLELDYLDNVVLYAEYTEENAQTGEFSTEKERLWWTVDVQKTTNGEFLHIGADLSSYAGKVIRLVLEARNDDNNNFGYEGFYVDSVVVKTGCGSILECAGEGDCESANPCVQAECTPLVNTGSSACFGFSESPSCTPCLTGQDFECNDFDTCTIDACIGNKCSYETDIACCEDAPTWGPYEFEEGQLPLNWVASEPVNNVGWSVADIAAKDGFYHLYFGNAAEGDYDADEEVPFGTLTTPMLQLPDSGGYLMGTMDLMLLTEWLGFDPDDNAIFGFNPDRFTIDVVYNSNGVESSDRVFDSYDIGGATGTSETDYGYTTVNFELTAYSGDPVRFKFTFDGADEKSNTFGGVFIDGFGVYSVCSEPECNLSTDCDDGSTCTDDQCVLGECINEKEDPLCCTANGECDDENPCTVEFCVEGTCDITIPDPSCCFESGGTLEDFDGETDDWSFGSSDLDVGWSFIEGEEGTGLDGTGYLYFGNTDTGTYETSSGSLVFGQAISPPIQVEPSGVTVLNFQMNLSTEWDDQPFIALPFATDRFTVYVQTEDSGSVEVWNSDLIGGTTQGDWQTVEVGLAAYVGQTIQFKLEFNTGDGDFNDYGGVMIDGLNVSVVCSDVECFSPFECQEDTDPCTIPACFDNLCGFDQVDSVECCVEKAKQEATFDNEDESSLSGYSISSFVCGETSGYNALSPTWEPSSGNCLEAEDAAVQWHVSDNRSKDGSYSMYFGQVTPDEAIGPIYADEEAGDANAVAGYVVGPPVALYVGKTALFSAWAYVDVEEYNEIFKSDNFEVLVIDSSGTKHKVWGKGELETFQYKQWVQITSDLSAFEGQVIQLMFSFDSYDNVDNNVGEGIYVDQVQVIQECDNVLP